MFIFTDYSNQQSRTKCVSSRHNLRYVYANSHFKAKLYIFYVSKRLRFLSHRFPIFTYLSSASVCCLAFLYCPFWWLKLSIFLVIFCRILNMYYVLYYLNAGLLHYVLQTVPPRYYTGKSEWHHVSPLTSLRSGY